MCEMCGGIGVIQQEMRIGPMVQRVRHQCPSCNGKGSTIDPRYVCKMCSGKCTIRKKETVESSSESETETDSSEDEEKKGDPGKEISMSAEEKSPFGQFGQEREDRSREDRSREREWREREDRERERERQRDLEERKEREAREERAAVEGANARARHR